MLVDDGGQRLEVADDAGRGLRMREENRLRAGELLQTAGEVVGVRNLAPGVLEGLHLRPVGRCDRAPALTEVAGGDDEHAFTGRAEVRDRGLHRAGARRREQQHLALRAEDFSQAREGALVHRLEIRPAMMDDRLRDRRQDLRRDGRRARRQQVPLLAHFAEPSSAIGFFSAVRERL